MSERLSAPTADDQMVDVYLRHHFGITATVAPPAPGAISVASLPDVAPGSEASPTDLEGALFDAYMRTHFGM